MSTRIQTKSQASAKSSVLPPVHSLIHSSFTHQRGFDPVSGWQPEQCAGIEARQQLPVRIQTKLTIGQPGDKYEQEADRVANDIMSMRQPQLQRACSCDGGCPTCQTEQPGIEPEHLQTKRVQASDAEQFAELPIVREVLAAPGQPLDSANRDFMETRFGHNLGHVRVHADAKATESARVLNALAYTVGQNIVFGAGQYAPNIAEGRRLLAHELTHVVQQQDNNPVVQCAPSFEDCSHAQEVDISTAIATGTGWVRTALRELKTALGGSISAHTGALLTRDFHTHAAADIQQIIDGFNSILSGLTGSITYECESWCIGEKCGYVYAFWTDVHFCPSFFSASSSPTFRARCLVHELAHKEAGVRFDTYEYDPGYSSLTPAQAIRNADSYAVFARDI